MLRKSPSFSDFRHLWHSHESALRNKSFIESSFRIILVIYEASLTGTFHVANFIDIIPTSRKFFHIEYLIRESQGPQVLKLLISCTL